MKAKVIKFPWDRYTPAIRQPVSATIIVLPVIPIARFVSRRRRKRKLPGVFVRGAS